MCKHTRNCYLQISSYQYYISTLSSDYKPLQDSWPNEQHQHLILGQNPPRQNPPTKTPPDKTSLDKIPPDKTTPDKIPPDKIPPDKTPRTKPPDKQILIVY